MPEYNRIESDFLRQLTTIVKSNLSNEQFGVSELAHEMSMSRSNLLRKVKKETKLSVSQLINQERLKRGMELLRTSAMNVSEVSHQVGFGSTSYFIKCFREYYGYSPGEVGKRDAEEKGHISTDIVTDFGTNKSKNLRQTLFKISAALIIVIAVGILAYYTTSPSTLSPPLEKSIAVLPFKNESNDSTNLYLINGLMESTLNNLQKIKDLKVISRTSTEKYRNASKSIPEMASELNVNYFVEGSGQKIGDQILLNVQLIEASNDRHLWARQYRREAKDIFALQQEIASSIAEEIQAIITPDEKKRIEKTPTENLMAYDLFLKGRDLLNKGGNENLETAITYFKEAILQDNEFALAYADAALTYYYLDMFQTNKKYTEHINNYADKALLYDPKLAESLIAKAVFYINKKEYESAVPHLEKALEYNPNSMLVLGFLTDFYYLYIPNTEKYLEYALKGFRLDAAAHDSVTISNNYLRLSHALVQTGFIDEAHTYIDKSLEYNSDNIVSEYLKVWIQFFQDRDFTKARTNLIKVLDKDTTRIDVLQEVGKICFYMGDFESAYRYYKQFIDLKEKYQLDMYKHENLVIGIVLSKVGLEEESQKYVDSFKEFAENDRSVYKHLFLVAYYSYLEDTQKAIEHLRLFSKEDNYVYYVLLWDIDTGIDPVKDNPEFQKIMGEIETKFWNNHKRIKLTLEEQGLL